MEYGTQRRKLYLFFKGLEASQEELIWKSVNGSFWKKSNFVTVFLKWVFFFEAKFSKVPYFFMEDVDFVHFFIHFTSMGLSWCILHAYGAFLMLFSRILSRETHSFGFIFKQNSFRNFGAKRNKRNFFPPHNDNPTKSSSKLTPENDFVLVSPVGGS